jgi:hypothetical protein
MVTKYTPAALAAMKILYQRAKEAKVGTEMFCPGCGRTIQKTVYNKVFCTNQKTENKRSISCKDFYWNTVVPERVKALGRRT